MELPFFSNNECPPGLKFLVLVVDREKADLYTDMLSNFDISVDITILARGSASEEMLQRMGISSTKAVIAAAIREDIEEEILSYLGERFKKKRNGKGIAFTIPFAAMIGVNAYKLLSCKLEDN